MVAKRKGTAVWTKQSKKDVEEVPVSAANTIKKADTPKEPIRSTKRQLEPENDDLEDEEDELPEIIPDYASDTSDEETNNTIGNIPIEWYADHDHIGYDIHGKTIAKPAAADALDSFLATMDNPNSWRSVLNKLEGKDVVLSEEDLNILKRIKESSCPEDSYDAYEPTTEWFTSVEEIHPLNDAPEPKRRFIPSKNEAARIMKIVRAIKKGWIKSKEELEKQRKPEVYNIWEEGDEAAREHPMHIPAPKLRLPGNNSLFSVALIPANVVSTDHRESYNPPVEYIPTKEEIAEWEALDPQDRPQNFIPHKYPNLRSVPGYARFVQERFDRCLDLYLCPRIQKNKINIDPESLIPKLPSRKELEPYPTQLSIIYDGHQSTIRSFSVDPTGKWLASGSDDCTVKCWEVATGRCMKTWKMDHAIRAVVWNPNPAYSVLAVLSEKTTYLLNPGLSQKTSSLSTDELFANMWSFDSSSTLIEWHKPTTTEYEQGFRAKLSFTKDVSRVVWHRKGDYFATVCPSGGNFQVAVHQISKRQSQNPFKKSYGTVQDILFHPSKPYLFVATERYVRVYNLVQQALVMKLHPGVKWISTMDVHPKGDNLLVGSYDKRVCWFDTDLSSKPYKTLRYHTSSVKRVSFHKRYPLFASCSDDGSVNVFHGMVYNNFDQNPLIVPLKSLKAHEVVNEIGAMHCEFHPHQPWIFSCGVSNSKHQIKLFV
ncbi:Ribosome biogenesis protein 1 [Blyttiomyces sp. JEL0837]|nr:Ribosome biogenesis protein 1 [Blyttiomyces sp. JEL0837]